MRFAPLIRVSTEQQEKRGESLHTQKKQIIQYVKTLNGTIPDSCWKYSGQEHATVGEERKNLDMLLSDSTKDLFDAVIVCDVSRWSRDNAKNKAGLQILRDNKIKFYVGSTEYDLYDPQATLFLGMSTEMNEFFAMEQSRKSLLNRIERAKQGIQSAGKPPYGRTFDRSTNKWGIDKEKKDKIRMIANQYIKGGSILKLSKTYDMNASSLLNILKYRCGDTWSISFKSKRLNIDESVSLKIPRLLPEKTIKAIHEKTEANKTYSHGQIKHKYLLSSMIFCEKCGRTLSAQTNSKCTKYRYYRLSKDRHNDCGGGFTVHANRIEEAVLLHLFKMYGDAEYLKRAMQRAIPNKKRIARLREERESSVKRAKQIESKINKIVDAIGEGVISKDESKKSMQSAREQGKLNDDRIKEIDSEIGDAPTESMTNQRAKLFHRIHKQIAHMPEHLSKMSYDDTRKLIIDAFSGKDNQGNNLGVYVKKDGEEVIYTIKGVLSDLHIKGKLPLSDLDWIDLLKLDLDYQDVDKEIDNYKLNMRGLINLVNTINDNLVAR